MAFSLPHVCSALDIFCVEIISSKICLDSQKCFISSQHMKIIIVTFNYADNDFVQGKIYLR